MSNQRRGWEKPAFTELKIKSGTKSSGDTGMASRPEEPKLPAAPTTKLGFSFEWSFPLSSRLEK